LGSYSVIASRKPIGALPLYRRSNPVADLISRPWGNTLYGHYPNPTTGDQWSPLRVLGYVTPKISQQRAINNRPYGCGNMDIAKHWSSVGQHAIKTNTNQPTSVNKIRKNSALLAGFLLLNKKNKLASKQKKEKNAI